MSDELEQAAAEAAEASLYAPKEVQQFLKHPGVVKAMLATEHAIITHWKAASDPLSREMCWHELQAFKRFQTKLKSFSEKPLPSDD